MFEGMYSAIVTPFQESQPGVNPEVDYESLERLIEWQLASGVSGLVVCGSTGEAMTLSDEEKIAVIKRSMEIVRGRVPVIAGTGTNCTHDTIAFTKRVKDLKVDGALVVAPYYNKPTQEGLFEHFRLAAAEGGLPVVVYNIPGRSVVEISIETFAKLKRVPGIVAVKHSVDSASRLVELADAVGDKLAILAGDDPITYAVMSVGGKGVISASGTVIPKEMAAITSAGLKGDLRGSFEAQKRAMPLIKALFMETNPIPAKAALKILGHIKSDSLRLPLVSASETTKAALKKIFTQ